MDQADLGNEKASLIEADRLSQSRAQTNVYVIGHCSADGFTTEVMAGDRAAREQFLKDREADPYQPGTRWAFAQWSKQQQGWGSPLASDSEMERELRSWLHTGKPPMHLR